MTERIRIYIFYLSEGRGIRANDQLWLFFSGLKSGEGMRARQSCGAKFEIRNETFW